MAGSRSAGDVFRELSLCIFRSTFLTLLHSQTGSYVVVTRWLPRVPCIQSILRVKSVERASSLHNSPNRSPRSDSYCSKTGLVPSPAPITEASKRTGGDIIAIQTVYTWVGDGGQKAQTSACKINKSWADMMYSTMTAVSNTVVHIWKLLREKILKFSSQEKQFCNYAQWQMLTNLLWLSFCNYTNIR